MDKMKLRGLVLAVLTSVLMLAAYVLSDGATTNFDEVEGTVTAVAALSQTPTKVPTYTNTPTRTVTPVPKTATPTLTSTPFEVTAFPTPTITCLTPSWCEPEKAYYIVTATTNLRVRDLYNVSGSTVVGSLAPNTRLFVRCIADKGNGEIWLSQFTCFADEDFRTWFAMTLSGVQNQWVELDPNQD